MPPDLPTCVYRISTPNKQSHDAILKFYLDRISLKDNSADQTEYCFELFYSDPKFGDVELVKGITDWINSTPPTSY
jgi:hypothetical protein